MHFSPRTVGWISAALTVLIWTAFIVITRASAAHQLLPMDILLPRIGGASCVLLPWAWWLMRKARRAGTSTGSLFGLSPLPVKITVQLGLLGGLMYALFSYNGFFYAPAGHASVLMTGSLPLWTTLLAWWILREQIASARALGLLFIVVGDLLVGGTHLFKAFDGGDVWKGDLMFMAAALSWSSYSIVVRRYGLDAVRATMATSVFACLTYVPVFGLAVLLGWLPTHLMSAPWQEIAFQALFQGVGSVVISGMTFTHMIRYFGPVRSTMVTAVVPGLSALGAAVFLQEPMHWNLVLGLALVTCGIVFGVRQATSAQKSVSVKQGWV